MRKFRVWDKVTNKMHIGNTGFHLFSNGALGFNSGHDYEVVDSNNFEVLFYTGLKDKNGKEIYEGDIVYPVKPYMKTEPDTIVFVNGCFWIKNKIRTESELLNYPIGCYPLYRINTEQYLEIIGNIFTTPELLNPLNKQS